MLHQLNFDFLIIRYIAAIRKVNLPHISETPRKFWKLFKALKKTFIRIKFVCTNIFGHSFVSVLECIN